MCPVSVRALEIEETPNVWKPICTMERRCLTLTNPLQSRYMEEPCRANISARNTGASCTFPSCFRMGSAENTCDAILCSDGFPFFEVFVLQRFGECFKW